MGRGEGSEAIKALAARSAKQNQGRIHEPWRRAELAKITAAQCETAQRLAAQGAEVYFETTKGASVVSSWNRYLLSGDSQKITKSLYTFLTMKCGYIAHFDIHGFRSNFANPQDLLRGESSPATWDPHSDMGRPVEHSQYVYSDGKSSDEVYQEMLNIVEELG